MAVVTVLSASAVEPSDFTIYVNPGHGGYDSDDRVMTIYPFTSGDTATFAESKSNLGKGFRLRELLREKGYNVVMSRVRNTTADDLGLSTIVALSNASNADLFLSIHSNATGVTARRNYPLILFRGYDDAPELPASKVWATHVNTHLLTNQATVWTSTNMNVRGDWDFQKAWGTQGYGVLRGQTMAATLSEGSFHDYIPEAYRLLNDDFYWLEGWNFRKAVNAYFGIEGVDYGGIIGRLNDERVMREGDFIMYDDDKLATIQAAKVELYDETGTTKLDEKITDNLYNGIYAFRKLAPGKYMVKCSSETHYPVENVIEVVADEVSYWNPKMKKVRNTPPVVTNYSPVWTSDSAALLCNTPIVFDFNWDMDVESTEAAFSIEPPVEGTFTWEDQNYRMIFTPNNPYEISTLYTVKLATTAQHGGGMTMENPVEFQFFTTDRNFMAITGLYPNEGEEVHYKGAQIEVRFDKIPNVIPILNQAKVYDSAGTAVALNKRAMSYSKAGAEYGYFRLPFTSNLKIGETYTLELSSEIADNDGITLQDGLSLKFTAVDAGTVKTDAVVDAMEDATIYTQDEQGSVSLVSSKVAANSSLKLFDSKALAFTYEFESTEGGEVLWTRAASDVNTVSTDALGVHVYGDLTGNEVYIQMTSSEDVKYVKVCDMTFLGWKYIVVPMTDLEGGKVYNMTGVKVVQNASIISRTGTLYLDNVSHIADGAGLEEVLMPELKIYPNPVSELLIADADGIIERIEVIAADGVIAASAASNVVNVSELPEGVYFAKIYKNGTFATRKVVVKH